MDRKNIEIDSAYCKDLFSFSRRKTCEVCVGNIGIGGNNPIRIQTMVTTPTSDIEATVSECIKLADAGAELVRITAPNVREAEALGKIRQRLRKAGCSVPLVADIHFSPDAAETAAKNVEKIRINPGNFTDQQAILQGVEYNWDADLQKLRTRFVTLLNICKQHGTALRIGSNHGSLSGRIMSRYGDTPEGMVESAMEFLRICRDESFHNVVVSMKASNTRVMVYAYRLLVATMNAEEMYYPLHLGVTEAGDGEDGRIKSAVGIGALLADGLGDTVRVSLTEAPENEIPVARNLVRYFEGRENHSSIQKIDTKNFNPYTYTKRCTHSVENIGGNNPVTVIADLSALNPIYKQDIESLGFELDNPNSTVKPLPDCIYAGLSAVAVAAEGDSPKFIDTNSLIFCDYQQLSDKSFIEWLGNNRDLILMLKTANINGIAELRACFLKLEMEGISNPVIIHRKYDESDFDKLQLMAAADLGTLLIDGFGSGIMISAKNAPKLLSDLSFRILQASRNRYTRTEYIACPGCGRTLFDLKTTLQNIKNATQELSSLKIGVMGCIVNGPGEMADADYGYVGAGPGKITLYKGKDAIKKNIPQEKAIDELIRLILK
ncbi:MAG: (E)-4-hydroxy-3-methylbut-2-enyl-diphosphate synthase [Prevotellaceae bacterium]|jgi:(E)-4-hydroxy-3-methylbut-2-enyl-diphosphate synthase|nr:(E)-4-hydroxy-3-methylbut-2-enyl-diphosphate synthase [Prevotellaceae bacterium]